MNFSVHLEYSSLNTYGNEIFSNTRKDTKVLALYSQCTFLQVLLFLDEIELKWFYAVPSRNTRTTRMIHIAFFCRVSQIRTHELETRCPSSRILMSSMKFLDWNVHHVWCRQTVCRTLVLNPHSHGQSVQQTSLDMPIRFSCQTVKCSALYN